MATEAHNKSITDLLPDTLIELFEVEVGGTVGNKKFHAGKIIDKDIILGGAKYYCLPIEATGFESKGDGTLPRPKLIVSNPDGLVTELIKQEGDMVGNVFKRIRIFLKFIDAVNFPESVNPFGNSDPDSRFDDDLYIFNRKVSENKYFVEFELVSPLEVENYKLPARIMVANYCAWKYRGIGCRYGSRDDYAGPTTNLESKEGGGKIQSVDFFPRRESVQKIIVSNAGSGTTKFKINSPPYSTGTATQSGLNVVGTYPVAWQDTMVGRQFTFTGGSGSSGYVTSRTNFLNIAVSVSKSVLVAETYIIGAYVIGDHTASPGIAVDAIPLALKVGDKLLFINQGVLTLSADAAAGATVVYGTVATTALPDNEVASLSYPVGDYSSPDGITVEPLARPIKFGQIISFGKGVTFMLNADADENAVEIFGDLTGGSVGTAAEGAIVDSSGFAVTDYRVQGVPIADARDKRFDDINNDFGLTGMRWVYEYNPTISDIALNAAVAADTISASSNALELSVVDVPEDINPKRTLTLFDSGGSEIGTLKVGALILKTVTVELTAEVLTTATNISLKPIPVSFKKGEIITFGASQTVTLTKDAGIGAELLPGTVSTASTIATGTSGTLRTTIKGALDLTTGTSIAADATVKVGYVKGDVVSISSFSKEPAALFVCIKDHTAFKDPRFKKEYWVEDQCSKTLNGCKMRFGEYHHLPFGGFPSIESYRYTN